MSYQVCFDLLPSGDPEGFLFLCKKTFFTLVFFLFCGIIYPGGDKPVIFPIVTAAVCTHTEEKGNSMRGEMI